MPLWVSNGCYEGFEANNYHCRHTKSLKTALKRTISDSMTGIFRMALRLARMPHEASGLGRRWRPKRSATGAVRVESAAPWAHAHEARCKWRMTPIVLWPV
jgi:hypothetical protein